MCVGITVSNVLNGLVLIVVEEIACYDRDELSHLIAPYTFPLLIEFCAAASTLLITIWEKCGEEYHHESACHPKNQSEGLDGHGMMGPSVMLSNTLRNKLYGIADRRLTIIAEENPKDEDAVFGEFDNFGFEEHSDDITDDSISEEPDVRPIILFTQKNRKLYYNNHAGFAIGWVLLSAVVVIIIIYSYMIYSDVGYTHGLEVAIYTTDIVLCMVCLMIIPYTARRMSQLSFKDQELKLARRRREQRPLHIEHTFDLDRSLLYQTFVALLAFQASI